MRTNKNNNLLLFLFCFLGCGGRTSVFGELYGAANYWPGLVIMRFDPEGVVTNISSLPNVTLTSAYENSCTFSQNDGIIYLQGYNNTKPAYHIYGISLLNGTVLLDSPSPPGIGVPQMAFDSNTNQIIFTIQNGQSKNWDQYLIDPVTGKYVLTNSFIVGSKYRITGYGSSFDPVHSIQWIPALAKRRGTLTPFQVGLALNGTMISVDDAHGDTTPVYSGVSNGTMYAWAYDQVNYQPIRAIGQWDAFDPQTFIKTPVPTSTWFSDTGNIGFDSQTNTLYGFFYSGEYPYDYFLVGVDIESGLTKSSVPLSRDAVPYCFGFANVN